MGRLAGRRPSLDVGDTIDAHLRLHNRPYGLQSQACASNRVTVTVLSGARILDWWLNRGGSVDLHGSASQGASEANMTDERRFALAMVLGGIVAVIFAGHEGKVVEALVAWPVLGAVFYGLLGFRS